MRLSPSWPACCALLVLSPLFVQAADEPVSRDAPLQDVIDHFITDGLRTKGIAPAPPADEAVLLRRTMLDLAGRIPTTAETREFLSSNDSRKRERLVDRLLAGPEFAFHHRNELDSMLMEDRRSDGAWREWLLRAAQENRPWDQMFSAMLLGRDDDPAERPALAFLKVRARELDDMTNDTSRLFFGINVSCAKCHDHPLVLDWSQDHYFGLASFFSRTYLTKSNRLAEKSRGGVKFKTTAGEEKEARLMFLTGTAIAEPALAWTEEEIKAEEEAVRAQQNSDEAPPPPLPGFSPRMKLVETALEPEQNRFFARNIANRLWARLMGCGLVTPFDQMHSSNPPSHPALLEWLADDLIAHGYDMQRVIRGVALSAAYARSSRWTGEGNPPEPETFAVAQVKPLTPRQLSLSLLIASSNPLSLPGLEQPHDWGRRREQLENAANGFADQIERPSGSFQVSVTEALLFSNSERVQNEYLRDSGDRLVGALQEMADPREAVEAAFEAVLSRAPEGDERQAFTAYIEERKDRRSAALQQVVWALLASPEFRFNY